MIFNNPDVHPHWREAWKAKEEALRTRYTKTLEDLRELSIKSMHSKTVVANFFIVDTESRKKGAYT